MSFLERARQAAEQARHVATETTARAQTTIHDPATREKARSGLHFARRTMSTAVERIDPSILADVVMKATYLQERANAALRKKGSNYRIGTVSIGAAIPPSVSFAIVRVGDPRAAGAFEGEPLAETTDEGEHIFPHHGDEPIQALDGSQLTDAELAATSHDMPIADQPPDPIHHPE
jgi:hypothetical protein